MRQHDLGAYCVSIGSEGNCRDGPHGAGQRSGAVLLATDEDMDFGRRAAGLWSELGF